MRTNVLPLSPRQRRYKFTVNHTDFFLIFFWDRTTSVNKKEILTNFSVIVFLDDFDWHSFDATKSTKGASKLRRDLINSEIANLRDLLPLPSSTRQRLSQLQLMALVCVYVRKANYFQHSKYCNIFPLVYALWLCFPFLWKDMCMEMRSSPI